MFRQENLNYYLFITLATLFIGIGFTSADFFTSPANDVKDFFILFSQWGTLMLALWSVIYLLSINKYLFGLFYPVICFLSGILMFFRYTTGTTLTTMIMDAALDNDNQLTYELISLSLIVILVVSVAIALLFVFYRFRYIKVNYIWLNLLSASVIFLILFNIPRINRPLSERIPFNLYFISSRYITEKKEVLKEREKLNSSIVCGENSDLLVLFVLGESLRPDHLGFNGYHRNTTPHLSKEDIISFQNIYSEYTYTNVAVPHIMTRADSIHPERAYSERSFIDIFKQCGFYTTWLANQESSKSYVYFMNESDTLIYANINKSPYVFDKWLDEALLPSLNYFIEKKEQKKMIILHTIGSHWYYNSHFPDEFQKFNPTTKSRIVKSNTPEEMTNSYDNTVLYTDFFIFQVINSIRNKNAVLIYLSDHGEALGENGIWLHANDALYTHRPACFIWMSEIYKQNYPEKYRNLHQNKDKYYRTDFLFPSILEAAGIESDIIDPDLSIFR
ncbi:MAG: phosphoethanolamine transferase [Dysgonamonadaceae bacterium]|jgi:glucan phosphoethanolaminetransferase (alkaline phosphatase superfamily)|nr:phosphoethanolamine transferase [Dysgonamonadaceae bacterium]